MIRLSLMLLALSCSPAAPDCAVWSIEPDDEMCERCDFTAAEPVMLVDGSIVVEAACQGDAP